MRKDVRKTFGTYDKISIVRQLEKLDENQIEAWINPIPHKYGFESPTSYRIVTILRTTNKYCLLLIMRCESELDEENEEERAINQQYIISVDKQGKYIDALVVDYEKNLSNWIIEFDANRNIYKITTSVGSFFEENNIRTVHRSTVSNTPDGLSGTWEIWDEVIYSVNEDGYIVEIVPRRQIREER
jgi:hypothetical protein